MLLSWLETVVCKCIEYIRNKLLVRGEELTGELFQNVCRWILSRLIMTAEIVYDRGIVTALQMLNDFGANDTLA